MKWRRSIRLSRRFQLNGPASGCSGSETNIGDGGLQVGLATASGLCGDPRRLVLLRMTKDVRQNSDFSSDLNSITPVQPSLQK
jgi:hypothetical protein